MIKIENIEVSGWKAAIRGMRNPLNSWAKSDSYNVGKKFILGNNDKSLALRLIKAGPEHRKFLRMIHVQFDITLPFYVHKELDTYKVSTVENGCSTMHKITSSPITLADFSIDPYEDLRDVFIPVVNQCEWLRKKYVETKDVKYWRALVQLLPCGYNQKRTWDGNYETILAICHQRENHKLIEWHEFRDRMFDNLPYLEEFYNAMKGEE